ncbi:oxidoreductase 2OG-Fe II oxygenase family [Pyrenophora tritici-repentis]|uniref:2OG-Fe oxygenase superprotein n=3 Tax=Pyrenophora tritici-repentis TaxID=45151 RepID=A0A2W1F1M7_9PLEO|nr:uncharacterized protein PTRG_05507 [Pyrenophora tritici-repentis Pt-1C-BFP]KAA8618568.1 Oxoglutarateiron-dependent dioxygenase [Pyrenophora tritici-repentis]EDU48427.1 conserved hypothetical protein [Pyrenophora tritici-repentis Pt-1C-BFP]KAF7449042.1 Oxoglutarateiron-dependent dioxygenase [Pyrenophora tritici-repentis]KAI0576951.1 Oxoglutarateiron-dependent dioxygenase [Pyrenophora tritici-repentis]KAI0585117.1 Oxoglutarateiron-dependent dioxygenase [Pyrenophora tritici-repentis]
MVAPIIPTMPAGIPLAALTTIDFQKLRSDDADEKQKLWQAATEAGFFYLNYENMPEFEDLAATVNGIYKLEHELFDLPDEFKMNYDVDKQGTMKLSGYKPIGRNIGGLPGNRDGHESWAIPKNAIFNLNPTQYAYPPLLSSHLPLVQTFMHHAQTLTKTIYTTLSTQLNLPNPSRLEHSHRPTHPSPCILRLLKVHAQPLSERGIVHTPHTDIGSLTVLFSNEPGLQILSPNPTAAADRVSDWEFVAPRANCAIVNLGDALAMLTGGRTKSALHRVGPLPGQAMGTRFSFAYLQRPEMGTKVRVMGESDEEEEVLIEEWIGRKFGVLRKETFRRGEEWVLTGRKGKGGIAT